jgi:hypothetical protein
MTAGTLPKSVWSTHMIIRPSFTVLGGTAIGLVAGAAVYGTISSASAATPTAVKPAKAVVAAAPAAHCAAGQKLEHGVCIIHVERTVVVAAPFAAPARVAAPARAGASRATTGAAGPTSSPAASRAPATAAAVQQAPAAAAGAHSEAEDPGSVHTGPEQGDGQAPSAKGAATQGANNGG